MTAKKKRTIIIIAAAAVVIAGVLIWLLAGRSSGGDDGTVYVTKVSDLTGQNYVSADRFAGVVESQQTVDYKRSGEADIEEIYVTAGQAVDNGTPLFKYDVTDAQNNISMANLEIEGINQQIAELRNSGSGDADTRLQIIQLQTDIKSKQISIQGYQKQVDQAVVKSSVKGIVKAVNESGQDASGAEAPIVSVTEMGEFRVKGSISEQQFSLLNVGQSVIIRSRTDETQTWKGTISVIQKEPKSDSQTNMEYSSDDSSQQASQYPFYVSMENTDGLMLGQHVYIEPDYGQSDGEAKSGIWIDSGYVVTNDDGSSYVWVSEHNKLKKRTVTLGSTDEEMMTVEITDGLSADDSIAWPDNTYTEGMKTASDSTEVY